MKHPLSETREESVMPHVGLTHRCSKRCNIKIISFFLSAHASILCFGTEHQNAARSTLCAAGNLSVALNDADNRAMVGARRVH